MNEMRDLVDAIEQRVRSAITTLEEVSIRSSNEGDRCTNPREAASKIRRALTDLREADRRLDRAVVDGVRTR